MAFFFQAPVAQNPAVFVDPFLVVGKGGEVGAVFDIDAWGRPVTATHKPFTLPPPPMVFGGAMSQPFLMASALQTPMSAPTRPQQQTPSPAHVPYTTGIASRVGDRYVSIDELDRIERSVGDLTIAPSKPVSAPAPAPASTSSSTSSVVYPKPSVLPTRPPTKSIPGPKIVSRCTGCSHCNNGVTGAGCLILVKSKRGGMQIVLGREAHGRDAGNYSDLGGKLNPRERIWDAASREVYEESAHTIAAPRIIKGTPYVDIQCGSGRHYYRCYIIRDDSVKCGDFYNAIRAGGVPAHSLEMDRLTRFPLKSFKTSSLLHSTKQAVTDQGHVVQLSDRVATVLVAAIDAGHI